MFGEIDIEEHDLMDNPRVRTIFPDITLLKKEIVDADHEVSQKQITPDISKRPDKVGHKKQGINDSLITNIKEEVTNEDNVLRQADIPSGIQKTKSSMLHSNVLVFGTNPSKTTDKKLKCRVNVKLKDINQYLIKSKCYCNICKTLFTKTKNFKEHMTWNHNYTYRYNRDSIDGQVDDVMDSEVNTSEGNPTHNCFHCKEKFLSQELLIEHLYEVLDKKAKARSESKEKSNQGQSSCSVSNKAEKCTSKTMSVDSCEAMSTEEELVDNQNKVSCDTRCVEALQCSLCSYYFQHKKFYEMHMKSKHKINVTQINIVKFNPTCVFCSNSYPTMDKYNMHLRHVHSSMISNTNPKKLELNAQNNKIEQNCIDSLETQEHNTTSLCLESSYDLINDRPLLFRSFLFKCLKCEIHFLSPRLATSHIIHSEILVNWKCSLCNIFFKRSDEDLHLKQHKCTDSFTFVNVEDKDLSRILIKCNNCALYVPETYFRHHVNVCEEDDISWRCPVCDINIEGTIDAKRDHNRIHSDLDNKKNDFIIINDHILNIHTNRVTVQDFKSKEDVTSISSVVSTESEIDNYSSDNELNGYVPIDNSIDKANKSSLAKGDIMFEKKLTKNNKSVIKCISQNTGNNPITKDSFVGKKNKLKRKFDDISNSSKKIKLMIYDSCSKNMDSYSNFTFKPPDKLIFLLNLTYCKNCECYINFYYKLDIHLENRCNNLTKRICNICGLALTPKLIISHKEFHELNPHLKLQDFRFYDIETCKQILPPIPLYPMCDICGVHGISKDEIRSHNCKETLKLSCDICEEKFTSEKSLNLHTLFHGYYLHPESKLQQCSSGKYIPIALNETNKNRNKCENRILNIEAQSSGNNNPHAESEEIKVKLLEESNTNETQDKEKYYLYTCEVCNITTGNYDHLVEHCHSHYNNSYKNIETEKCPQCNLIFDRYSIFLHKALHKTGLSNDSFENLMCDLFHFGRSNENWLNHVFKLVPESKREMILKDAIYKNECRIKLDISQNGDPELTLYQCTKCKIFIDDSDIFNHREECTGNNKKYPCDYCGIALMSASYRTRHLKLHQRRSLSIKSYRIIVFNRIKNKVLNDSISNRPNRYVMNKCRNCHGVVDWTLMKSHECNSNDLRKCHNCGLLIYNKDYDKHELKHKTSDTFNASNMKVVMFGQIGQESKINIDLVCSFSGIAVDYILYKCVKCDVCIRDLRLSSRHFCLIDAAKWKCPRCLLFFDEGTKKGHCAMHAADMEFTSDAICVIPFNPQETYRRLEEEINCKGINMVRESVESSLAVCIEEKSDILYRCPCGLHFLTEENAREHVERNKCGVISKKHRIQTCSKCHLNFTPVILYKHLLQHHADKYVKYSFDIVNVAKRE